MNEPRRSQPGPSSAKNQSARKVAHFSELMTLDLYAGGMTRYVAGDWARETEEWEAERTSYAKVSTGGIADIMNPSRVRNWMTRRRVGPEIERWAETVSKQLGVPVPLNDDLHGSWITRRLQFFEFDTLKLWAAHVERGKQLPEELPDDIFNDPLYREEADSRKAGPLKVLFVPYMWLPVEMAKVARIPWVDGKRKTPAHSTIALLQVLDHLQKRMPPRGSRSEAEEHAAGALALVREVATFSARQQTVMLLDSRGTLQA